METMSQIFARIKATQRNHSPDNAVCVVDHTAHDGNLYVAVIEKVPEGQLKLDPRFVR